MKKFVSNSGICWEYSFKWHWMSKQRINRRSVLRADEDRWGEELCSTNLPPIHQNLLWNFVNVNFLNDFSFPSINFNIISLTFFCCLFINSLFRGRQNKLLWHNFCIGYFSHGTYDGWIQFLNWQRNLGYQPLVLMSYILISVVMKGN